MRWGGLSGILGGLLFIVYIVILLGMIGVPPTDPKAIVAGFPDVRAATYLGETVYLAMVVLLILLFVALYCALRTDNPSQSIFGGVISLAGLVLLAAGGVPAVVFDKLSGLYQGGTAQDQAVIPLVWQALQGLFNEIDTMGFVLMSVGLIFLGIAMLRTSTFGRGYGGLSLVIGLVSLVGIPLFGLASPIQAILLFVVFPLVLGWKVYRLSVAT
jgi:hypothetical protein